MRGITMKQDYETPELVVYEDLPDVTNVSMIV
jgi:hypothetical protein